MNHPNTIKALRDALTQFTRAAYPVSTEIHPRGHNWSGAYLDAALIEANKALALTADASEDAPESAIDPLIMAGEQKIREMLAMRPVSILAKPHSVW